MAAEISFFRCENRTYFANNRMVHGCFVSSLRLLKTFEAPEDSFFPVDVASGDISLVGI